MYSKQLLPQYVEQVFASDSKQPHVGIDLLLLSPWQPYSGYRQNVSVHILTSYHPDFISRSRGDKVWAGERKKGGRNRKRAIKIESQYFNLYSFPLGSLRISPSAGSRARLTATPPPVSPSPNPPPSRESPPTSPRTSRLRCARD